ncbi:glutamyl-tRNA(Gln) amidotransferase subunit A [Pochonia chlamydosporia 170]|uniref:Glutamyl-tRNA(Gln) amidotransferase subunit A n=1 Tax=Pochonia chlamydosporia 170 TaxID=1380566 RepID=A0A179FIT4_METCM|nr:glutamyl-tRNA(Gln) amidotransferase subunit A [Pochonia chlamydosporia 170]OAQ65424.1 glutamyl-tRNA(Gln) amidotransferase subunit A [Pochonia chlamydosporia 170]
MPEALLSSPTMTFDKWFPPHNADETPSLFNISLDQVVSGLNSGQFTSVQLVRAYKARGDEVDHIFRSVIGWNPDAEAIARELDLERANTGPRSIFHGVPLKLKDNTMTLDNVPSTCGSTVLVGIQFEQEATVVQKLRQAGAIVVGKCNMTEFAGFRSTNGPTAWSPRGGQATGIFYPNMKAFGSSSGSAIATGLGITFASLGTETVSSIVGPAERSAVVGFKPTKQLVNTYGVIPVSNRQDTIGPLTRNVRDAAQILSIIVESSNDYVTDMDAIDMGNIKIGLLRKPGDFDEHRMTVFSDIADSLREMSAGVVDNVSLAGLQEYESLSEHDKSVAIKTDPAECYPSWNVEIMERANATDMRDASYLRALEKQCYFETAGGIEGAIDCSGCHVLLAPGGSLITQALAAMAGSPAISLPVGFYPEETHVTHDDHTGQVLTAPNIPFSVYLYSKRFNEAVLLRVAEEIERLTGMVEKRRPYQVPQLDLKDFV